MMRGLLVVVRKRMERLISILSKTHRTWPKSKISPSRWPHFARIPRPPATLCAVPETLSLTCNALCSNASWHMRCERLALRVGMVERSGLRQFILIFFLAALLFPPLTLAARKRVRVKRPATRTGGVRRSAYGNTSSSVKFRPDRKALLLTISNMGNVDSVSYQLTYLADGTSQGVMGEIDLSLESAATRELLFGTCSAGVCTYHTNISNMKLTVSSHLTSGVTVIKPYRIKP